MGGAVPEHGEGPSCAGSWEMPELCRIMGNARSCAGLWGCPSCAGLWGCPSCAGSWEIAE